MASRLIPLLIAALAAAAIGCGGSDANESRQDARASAATSQTGGAAQARSPFAKAIPGSRATVWAVGDSAGGGHAAPVAQLIRKARPDKVLYLGDIYNGTSGFRAYRQLYGGLPVARPPGNHDWPHFWSGPEWYSFTAGRWRIIELNSETSRRRAQLTYLRTLLRARGNCRLVFWHRPRYSAGPHGDATDMDPFWRALRGHARLVISGHDHDMQRFAPKSGLMQLVAGAGGESHYPVNRTKSGLAFADATHWGALRIQLSRAHAQLTFTGTDGRVLDAHSVTCRP